MSHLYLIALGGNIRHHRHGAPRAVLAAALEHISTAKVAVVATGPVITTAPVGPSQRRYANGAAIVETALDPLAMLNFLARVERVFGTRRGQRWRARVLDLDIILWSGGIFATPGLTIPHRAYRERAFVLAPSSAIAPDWRDPISGFTLRQLFARLTKPKRAPRGTPSASRDRRKRALSSVGRATDF